MLEKFNAALLFIGMGLGGLITSLPAPLDVLNPYLALVFLIVGVVFLLLK